MQPVKPPRTSGEAKPTGSEWRGSLHQVIFEADTRAGRAFDVALLVAIVGSVVAVCLESVEAYRGRFGLELRVAEWVFTGLFTVEYVARLMAVRQPWRYAVSFFGLVDLLSILPTYLSLVVPGAQSFLVIRALRLLRVFRILKLTHFVGEARLLTAAMKGSLRKITVFLGAVLTTVLIVGAAMYVIEGGEQGSPGFSSIPHSIYWAIVTMTTVGFGDVVPHTPLGKLLASILMIMGYGIIAVPTGIVSVEISKASKLAQNTQSCPHCGADGHLDDARFCRRCGNAL